MTEQTTTPAFQVQSRKIGADDWEDEFISDDYRKADAERRHLSRNDRSRQFRVARVEAKDALA